MKLVLIFIFISFGYSNASFLEDHFLFIDLKEIDDDIHRSTALFYENNQLFRAIDKITSLEIQNISADKKYKLILPDSIGYHGYQTYMIDGDSIFYNDYLYFHCFKITDDSCIHQFSTNISYTHLNIKKINEKVYLYDVRYSSNSINKGTPSIIEIIDLKLRKRDTLFPPSPSSDGFSYIYPFKVIDIDTNNIIISDFDKYRILMYDHNLNLLDSIIYFPKGWKIINDEIPQYPKNYHKPKEYIKKIIPLTARMSIINSIGIIAGNKLIVCWSIPTGNELNAILKFDIFTKKDCKWLIESSDNSDCCADSTMPVNYYNIKISNRFRIVGDYLISYFVGTQSLFEKNIGKTFKDFNDSLEQYFIEKPLKTIVFVYKIK